MLFRSDTHPHKNMEVISIPLKGYLRHGDSVQNTKTIMTQWLSGLYYADFISFYSPTQLCGGGTTKSNSNELPISVPLSLLRFILIFL